MKSFIMTLLFLHSVTAYSKTSYPEVEFEHSCDYYSYDGNSYIPNHTYKEIWEQPRYEIYFNVPNGIAPFYIRANTCKPTKMYYQGTLLSGGLNGDHDTDGTSNIDEVKKGWNPTDFYALPNACHLPRDSAYARSVWDQIYRYSPRNKIKLIGLNEYMNHGTVQDGAIRLSIRSSRGRKYKDREITMRCDLGYAEVIK